MILTDQDELSEVLARAVGDFTAARAVYDEDAAACDAKLWAMLRELGVTALLLPERLGGSGGGLADEVSACRVLARVAAPVPVVSTALASAVLAAAGTPEADDLARQIVASGEIAGVCLDAASAPGELRREADGTLSGSIALAVDAPSMHVLLVAIDDDWYAVRRDAPGLRIEEMPTLDRTRPAATVTLERAPATRLGTVARSDVEQLGWVLIAAEACGVAESALDLAVRYAKQRTQFGHPIGSFQAIKHKLVDDLIALEGARSALAAAVASASGTPWPARALAHMAKTVATSAASRVVGDAIQTHGAIANTWEHDAHLLLRRAKHCELVGGSPERHRRELGVLLRDGAVGSADDDAHLELTEADREFLHDLRQWLDAHVTPELLASLHSRNHTEQIAARRRWQRELADAGWAGIHWPVEHGGRAASLAQQVLYHHELAVRGLPPLIGNRGLSLIGPTLIAHGTPEQKRDLVEATRRADILWASGLSEREAGSDLASLRTRGRVDGDELVIDGHKIWTTSAQFADWIYCLIRTGPTEPKHAGITAVVVPLSAPGITVRPIRRITGYPDFNEVFFDGVRVPLTNVVGGLNNGWRVAKTTLSHEHMTNFLGNQMRLAVSVRKIIERARDGGVTEPALWARITDAWIDAQLLRQHGIRNVTRLAAGHPPGPEGSILKLFGQELERRLYELGVDAAGPEGIRAGRWATMFLSTRASTIGGGTSEVHRNKLGERVLGLPRDPAVQDAG